MSDVSFCLLCVVLGLIVVVVVLVSEVRRLERAVTSKRHRDDAEHAKEVTSVMFHRTMLMIRRGEKNMPAGLWPSQELYNAAMDGVDQAYQTANAIATKSHGHPGWTYSLTNT